MASTYSKLKIELIGTGDQAGQWGTTTNNNLGSSSAGVYRGLEQAIVGMATISSGFVANSYTLPYTNSNDDQEFRCLVLNITASLSNPSDLIVPAIQKPYIVINSSGQTVTVKVSGQTGVAVPNGAKILLYNTGTDVGTAITYLTELKLGGNLTMPSAGSINDSNGNELIKFPSAVASAVNELTISNAATGSAPTLSATGGDTNIGITLTPKGTGVVTISNLAATTIDTTNIEVTNIKAIDGTAAASIANSTGVITSVKDQVINGVTVGRGAGAVSTNTAVGFQAAAANTTGSQSSYFGWRSGYSNTTGDNNVAFGDFSLYANTTGSANTAIGRASLASNTTGANSTAVGYQALNANTTASNNTAVGYQAGYSNTTGSALDAFGFKALFSNTTGTFNVAIGNQSLTANSTGGSNTASGYAALFSNTTASNNSGIGFGALYYNTTGANNTAVGSSALLSNTTASNNTAVGYQAGYSNQTSGGAVFIGYQAGYGSVGVSTTINYNTAIGYQAGFGLTSGYNNTLIGNGAGGAITSGYKNTILGAYSGNQGSLDIRTASNYIVLSDGDGNPRFHFNGTTWFTFTLAAGAGTNALKFNTTTGAWTYDTSSARYKDNIRDSIYGLSHVMQMRSAQFEYKDTGRSDVGLIAEELDQIVPELVMKNKDGQPDAVSYDRMVSVLVKAIQELKSELDSVKAELATLKGV